MPAPGAVKLFRPKFLVGLRPDQERSLALILACAHQRGVSRAGLIREAVDLLIERGSLTMPETPRPWAWTSRSRSRRDRSRTVTRMGGAEHHVLHDSSGKGQQAVECSCDAHVRLLR